MKRNGKYSGSYSDSEIEKQNKEKLLKKHSLVIVYI